MTDAGASQGPWVWLPGAGTSGLPRYPLTFLWPQWAERANHLSILRPGELRLKSTGGVASVLSLLSSAKAQGGQGHQGAGM